VVVVDAPSYQRQQSGSALVDRIQEGVRDVIAYLRSEPWRLGVAYAALATNATIGIAAYATLLTADITTVLARSYLAISFSASSVHITNIATTSFQILVDGVVTKGCYVTYGTAGYAESVAMVIRVPVTRGPHRVLLQWKTDNTSARINASTVVEEHAHLLVQEVTDG
jgi:hypothetical protein